MLGSHGLSARRARRTKSRGPKGLQLEVGARGAPRLLVNRYFHCFSISRFSWWMEPLQSVKQVVVNKDLPKKIHNEIHWIHKICQLAASSEREGIAMWGGNKKWHNQMTQWLCGPVEHYKTSKNSHLRTFWISNNLRGFPKDYSGFWRTLSFRQSYVFMFLAIFIRTHIWFLKNHIKFPKNLLGFFCEPILRDL